MSYRQYVNVTLVYFIHYVKRKTIKFKLAYITMDFSKASWI